MVYLLDKGVVFNCLFVLFYCLNLLLFWLYVCVYFDLLVFCLVWVFVGFVIGCDLVLYLMFVDIYWFTV